MGNCLDYTVYPESNMYPGEINFERLNSMYLGYTYDDDEDGDGEQDGEDDNNDKGRRLRRVVKRYYVWA